MCGLRNAREGKGQAKAHRLGRVEVGEEGVDEQGERKGEEDEVRQSRSGREGESEEGVRGWMSHQCDTGGGIVVDVRG